MKIFENVAQMELSKLKADQFVETKGEDQLSDGKGSRFLIVDTLVNKNTDDADLANSKVAMRINPKKNLVRYPNWSHSLQIPIYFKGSKYFTSWDIKSLKPVRANTYYVDMIEGSDAGTGTESDPFKSLAHALGLVGDNEIRLVRAGKYYYLDGPQGVDPAKGVSIISTSGQAVFSHELRPRVWVEDEVDKGLYTTPSDIGNGENLKTMSLSAELRPIYKGSGDIQGGGYVVTLGRTPTNGVIGLLAGTTTTQIRLPNNANPNEVENFALVYRQENLKIHCNNLIDEVVYLENLTFMYSYQNGVIDVDTSTSGSTVAINNCKAYYSRLSDNFDLDCNGLVALYRCHAEAAYKDGFNYHNNFSVSGNPNFSAIEVECTSRFNGFEQGGTTHNGSTIHSAANIIRLNCQHDYNRNRNVHDVGGGAQSFNVGVKARGSWTDMSGIQCGFDNQDDTITMWCIGCETDLLTLGQGSNNNLYVSEDTVFGEFAEFGGNSFDYQQ